MAKLINKKNFIGLKYLQQLAVWRVLRGLPGLEWRVTLADLVGPIGNLLRFSASARGILEFFIGEDPDPDGEPLTLAELEKIADANSTL